MRKDTSFTDKKLSIEEFSDKYWLSGELPYQYHTMRISDGRDEREQLIINNIISLWNLERGLLRSKEKIEQRLRRLNREKIMLKLLFILQMIEILIAIAVGGLYVW